jgi:hypothetical protein
MQPPPHFTRISYKQCRTVIYSIAIVLCCTLFFCSSFTIGSKPTCTPSVACSLMVGRERDQRTGVQLGVVADWEVRIQHSPVRIFFQYKLIGSGRLRYGARSPSHDRPITARTIEHLQSPQKYQHQFFSPSNLTKSGSNTTFYYAMSIFGSSILFVLLERVVLGALNFPYF